MKRQLFLCAAMMCSAQFFAQTAGDIKSSADGALVSSPLTFTGQNIDIRFDLIDADINSAANYSYDAPEGKCPGQISPEEHMCAPFKLVETESAAGVFKIYPNPAINSIQLDFLMEDAGDGTAALQIFNPAGVLVFSENFSVERGRGHRTISVSNLPASLYIVKVQVGAHLYTQQLAISR